MIKDLQFQGCSLLMFFFHWPTGLVAMGLKGATKRHELVATHARGVLIHEGQPYEAQNFGPK
eukprot:1722558-Amphidinium_carterae.1